MHSDLNTRVIATLNELYSKRLHFPDRWQSASAEYDITPHNFSHYVFTAFVRERSRLKPSDNTIESRLLLEVLY